MKIVKLKLLHSLAITLFFLFYSHPLSLSLYISVNAAIIITVAAACRRRFRCCCCCSFFSSSFVCLLLPNLLFVVCNRIHTDRRSKIKSFGTSQSVTDGASEPVNVFRMTDDCWWVQVKFDHIACVQLSVY